MAHALVAEEGSTLSCGYLTVLENRAVPHGRTIRLFVTRAEPLEGDPPPDPVFVVGRDLGWAHQVALGRVLGIRAGRTAISMDPRGQGFSEPSLACPEVQALTAPSAGITLGTPEMDTALLKAVQACHDRLTASGIDLATYNLEAMTADSEDLRIALGIDGWNLISYGTDSSISFEIMRRYPEHVRTATFDSPMAPQVDRFTQAVVGTEWALGQIAKACRAERSCDAAFPHLHRAWNRALRRLHEHPSVIHDEDLDIVVDDATAVRYLRNNLAQGLHETRDVPEFPSAVYDLLEHGWVNGGPAGDEVGWAAASPMTVGYDIEWGDTQALHFPANIWGPIWSSQGAFYSYMCHDEVPFIDRTALKDAAGGKPWYVEAYLHNPYPQICERWGAGEAEADPHATLTSDIPTLMMVGQFDPFSPLRLLKQTAETLATSWVVEARRWSRNVLGWDCPIAIRDAFVAHPKSQPDTDCLADLDRIDFVLPPPPAQPPGPDDAVITTVAGDGAYGSSGDGNLATRAQLGWPEDVVVDAEDNAYIVEVDGGRVRRVDASSGRISTVVGPPTGIAPAPPGKASEVELREVTALAIDDQGNLYIGGGGATSPSPAHFMILRVDPSSGEVTRIAGTGEKGFSGDGGPATEATTSWVRDIAIDDADNVYFADFGNHRVRMVDASGTITTIAGTGEKGFSGDGGPATEARIKFPWGIAVDADGSVYIADGSRVRRIDTNGVITTVAGIGKRGYSGDGGPATKARLGAIRKLAFDAKGNLYIWSLDCGCVRMVNHKGIIRTVVGRGTQGFSGDGGPATRAQLSCCGGGMDFGPDGTLYIADAANSRVRKVVFP